MKRRDLVLVVCLWSVLPGTLSGDPSAPEIIQRHEQSVRGVVDGLPFLLLRGTHAERGEAHGFLGATEILKTADGMARLVAARNGDWQDLVQAARRFSIEERYEEELAGMLRGIRMALPEARERQLGSLGREATLEDLRALQTGDVFELMRCSQFSAWDALTPDGKLILGRNSDYPPIFPRETCCLIAVDPAETGLAATMDPLWFGIVGAGIATLREDGLFLALNSGGRGRPSGGIERPVPGALLLRTFAESSQGPHWAQEFVATITGKLVLPVIVHLAPPAQSGGAVTPPEAVEYRPEGGSFIAKVREPGAAMPALFIANHYIDSEADLDAGRSGILRTGIESCIRGDWKIDFDEARTMLHRARQKDTYYSVVVWPQERRMRIGIADEGRTATEGDYADAQWDRIFSSEQESGADKFNSRRDP